MQGKQMVTSMLLVFSATWSMSGRAETPARAVEVGELVAYDLIYSLGGAHLQETLAQCRDSFTSDGGFPEADRYCLVSVARPVLPGTIDRTLSRTEQSISGPLYSPNHRRFDLQDSNLDGVVRITPVGGSPTSFDDFAAGLAEALAALPAGELRFRVYVAR